MQRLLITTEAHARTDARGHVYCDGPANYRFWSAYATLYDQVTVLARGSLGANSDSNHQRADGSRVAFCLIPDFCGPLGLLEEFFRVQPIVRHAIEEANVCLLRAPGLVSHVSWRMLKKMGRRYALEVVGDPWDSFSPGSWPSALRPAARSLMTKELKQMCEHASAVHYVTQRELQRRFPPGLHTHVASYSDVMVEGAFPGANVFAQRYRRIAAMAHDPASTGPFRIGFVGSLSRLYKGLDILLQAISAIIKSRDTELQLVIVGGGLYLDRMKALASTLNLESRTLFLGQLPFGEPVFSLLDSIDLLVLPSRAEGLPRIIIEAIVRGCPCIGTNIGGMSELLSQEDLVPCNCPEALKSRIVELIRQPERLRRMIERNLETSRRFTPDVLVSAQRAFLQQIKQNCYT